MPCYILFRMDSATKDGWLLANWVPEKTKVRQKMLYASSRETLKKELGSRPGRAPVSAQSSVRSGTPAIPDDSAFKQGRDAGKRMRGETRLEQPLARNAHNRPPNLLYCA